MIIKYSQSEFKVMLGDVTIIHHTSSQPFFYTGNGNHNIDMYRGNFQISDQLITKLPLKYFKIEENDKNFKIILSDTPNYEKELTVTYKHENSNIAQLSFTSNYENNRYWLRLTSNKEEKYYGCGEQLSYFNLKGRNFPLWTSEPGVGRDKTTHVTFMADKLDKAGGDYYNTNYPEPTFISDKKYLVHLDCTAYMDFNFKNDDFVELESWSLPNKIVFAKNNTFLELFEDIKELFGTQPRLPEWIYNGFIIGVQGGTERSLEILEKTESYGIKVSGLWCQDWQGKKITSFGKRLYWDWQWSSEMYPELDTKIYDLKNRGIRFMGYINPYLINTGPLYKIAYDLGYFATTKDDKEYLVDFGEFDCGVIDFTNPDAYNWYKELIKTNLIDFGLDGWMADFGEYLPTDLKLYNNIDAEIMHNAWPALWAKCNYDAVKESGKLEEVVYFMRAGFSGNQKYCPLLWAGDQSVDFSLHDGLASVIPAALSSGMIGNGIHHSDLGGYTSLHGTIRTPELFARWAEMACFTPVMRSHEGNRPHENFQYYDSEKALIHLSKMTNVYMTLVPYLKDLVEENTVNGIPVQRPLFVHYEDDEKAYDLQYQYMYGSDIIVAPVHEENIENWDVYLPKGEWVHFSTGLTYEGKQSVNAKAAIGMPPAFYKKGSKYTNIFKEVEKILIK